jgi:hypothetical protein
MSLLQLAQAILGLTSAEQAMPALVFPPNGCPHESAVPIIGLVLVSPVSLNPAQTTIPMLSTGKQPRA